MTLITKEDVKRPPRAHLENCTGKTFRASEAEALKNPVRGAEAELGINESIRERLFTHLNSLRSVWTARQDQAKKSAGWMPRH